MKAECLPFSQIPHTTPLFADLLSSYPRVQSFYPRSPYIQQWLAEEAPRVRYDAERRERVSAILQRQNQSWGASAQTLENIGRLRRGAVTAVTGQQVGLFGGPLFSIYKALTAVKLADAATRSGVDCVPVFWLATEDHDLAEVNQASIPGPDAAPQRFVAATPAPPDTPVGSVTFGNEIQLLLEEAAELLGDSEIIRALRDSYRPRETFGSAFARLFANLFREWGVVLLDAADPELHHVAAPIYRAAIERAAELDDALLVRGNELEAAGYHQQVKVTPSSALLFTLRHGARVPVHRRSSEFSIENDNISQRELLARIAATPQDFSPNVLLRPVVQDYLLPTLAYTGGAAEVAYFAQAAVVYERLLGRTTPVVPRFSATLIEPKLRSLLDRYGLSLPDLFHGPEPLREQLAARTLPSELRSAFDNADASLTKSLGAIRAALQRLDKTLVDAADNAESKMRHQLEGLRARAARAELRQTEVLARHTQLLSNSLYPDKTLQEREIAGIYFLSRYGKELLRNLYDAIHADCLDHQVISL
ncbi:MAG TPA: bacillithiol biosynthesis cysteine-adding enzyme BshC [Terriglobales bacterium]|nr:bacillithiol biosynthesis cysteine-adding enzyme BshC [Terriglobales bacterium]